MKGGGRVWGRGVEGWRYAWVEGTGGERWVEEWKGGRGGRVDMEGDKGEEGAHLRNGVRLAAESSSLPLEKT